MPGPIAAMFCIWVVDEVKKIPFWKREKVWKEKYEEEIVRDVVEPIEKRIKEVYGESLISCWMKRIMEEVIRMVKISKMKYRGCCFNCLLTQTETDIYRIEVEDDEKIEICKDCLSKFVEEINKEYLETVGG